MRALGLRDFAGLRRDDEPLDPFELAYFARLMVINFDEIAGLSEETREHLLGVGMNDWSGGTSSRPLPLESRTFTLLTPPLGVSTAAVYAEWDRMGGPTAPGLNDLEPAAAAVEPRLAVWRDRLGDATGKTPALAGSGSTWFVEGAHPGNGRVVVRTEAPDVTAS